MIIYNLYESMYYRRVKMEWVKQEVTGVDFGDKRLEQRMEKVLSRLENKPSCSIPQAGGGWSETITTYRFFDNDKVTLEPVHQPHYEATLERISQPEVVFPKLRQNS